MTPVDFCLYKSITYDPETSLPLYVLDTTYIPSDILNISASAATEDPTKTDPFITQLIAKMPTEPHVLVLFTNGFYKSNVSQDDSFKMPLNLIKILKLIPNNLKKFLVKAYVVHSNWLLKSIVDLSKKFYINSNISIISCANLSDLSKYVDITKIKISLHTYLIDKIQFKNDKIILNRHLLPLYKQPITIFNNNQLPLSQFKRIFNNLVSYLSNRNLDVKLSIHDWNTIIKCTDLKNETKISIDILSDCLKRDQLLMLSDYSFVEHYMIIIKFLVKLSSSRQPIIPLKLLVSKKGSRGVNFESIDEITIFFNEILNYKYDLNNDSNLSNNFLVTNDINQYDNSYLIIKLFKLFKYLLNKLEREATILEPLAKNVQKSIERQKLRLILSFTKILYPEEDDNDDDDDIGFDNLFNLLSHVLSDDMFNNVKIWNTSYTIDDFNDHISFEDFLSFENFKNEKLGLNDIEILEKNASSDKQPTSPVKQSKNDFGPLPPPPRKSKLLHIQNNSASSLSSTRSTSSSTISSNDIESKAGLDLCIPVSKSNIEDVAKDLESLGLDDEVQTTFDNDIDLYKTPKSKFKSAQDYKDGLLTPTNDIERTPVISDLSSPKPTKPNKPDFLALLTPQKNNNLRKYTEKDLLIKQEFEKAKQEAMKKEEHAKEVEKGVRRGERKVSRLARLYEEKYQL